MISNIAAAGFFASALGLFAAPGVAAQTTDASALNFLSGTYTCKGSDGTDYQETIQRPFGNNVIRGTDIVKQRVIAEHTFGFDSKKERWYAVSFYDGKYDTMSSAGSSPYSAMSGTMPNGDFQIMHIRRIPSGFLVSLNTMSKNKPFIESDRCTK